MTVPEALQLAIQRHQAGQWADAEALYGKIISVQPGHAEAMHYLGVVAYQTGRNELAVDWIRKALTVNPNDPSAHLNLGSAYRALGRLNDAIDCYHRAIALKADLPEAHYNLGNGYKELGQLNEAAAAFRRALHFKPHYFDASNNLGVTLTAQGFFEEAVTALQNALRIQPHSPQAHVNLGIALAGQGHFEAAIAAYRRALEIEPAFSEAHSNLGNALSRSGQHDAAVAAHHRAIEINPNHPQAHNNLGTALDKWSRHEEAIAAYRRALEIKPDYPEALNNLGSALKRLGRLEEAIAAHRRAIELRPDYASAHYNLGNACKKQGQLDEALSAFRRALALEPEWAEAHNNLGNTLADQSLMDEAVVVLRRAIELKPDQSWLHSNLVYTLHFDPGHDETEIATEKRRWNQQFGEPLKRFIPPHANDRDPERRLRIGYVSPDFRGHVVGRNILPLFRFHDRQKFEVICYAGNVRADKLTEEFRHLAHQWRDTFALPDEDFASQIRRDGVDILVDLSQHMAGNRLTVFARQPAPVQASFAGYPESTGLDAIGYRISDRYLESEIRAAEQVILIDNFWCYDPGNDAMNFNALPAHGNGAITFGCLNNFCKTNPPLLRLWARVLAAVQNSRLVILSPEGSHRQTALNIFQKEGIEAQRVEFIGHRERKAYLELYHSLDIALDPFPYAGHTTSLDALWMGVPVISLVGEKSVSRAGLSQLTSLGLQEIMAYSEDDYLRIAVQLAGDIPRLAELRATLRTRMTSSPLMDAPRFARNIEAAYRTMWRRWCSQQLASRGSGLVVG